MHHYPVTRFNALFVFVTFLVFVGCSQDYSKETLQGKWKVASMEANMPELSPAIIKSGEELALSTTYWFKEDGTSVETSSYYPDGIPGVWRFDADSMTLHINSTDEAIPSNAKHKVAFINKREITLTQDYDKLGELSMKLIKVKK